MQIIATASPSRSNRSIVQPFNRFRKPANSDGLSVLNGLNDLNMFYLIQLLNAVQYGLLLFLLASGLTLIFGIMGVINLAHGSFYMVGAYLAYWLA
jgi:ABC-type branched-subunit amino acid transport system permease subunit